MNPQVDELLQSLPGWKQSLVREIRQIVIETSPDIEELWKWETPVWAFRGNLAAVGVFQDHVKLNFFQGAKLTEFQHVFNSGLEAKQTRAIDFFGLEDFDRPTIEKVVKAAFALNSLPKKG